MAKKRTSRKRKGDIVQTVNVNIRESKPKKRRQRRRRYPKIRDGVIQPSFGGTFYGGGVGLPSEIATRIVEVPTTSFLQPGSVSASGERAPLTIMAAAPKPAIMEAEKKMLPMNVGLKAIEEGATTGDNPDSLIERVLATRAEKNKFFKPYERGSSQPIVEEPISEIGMRPIKTTRRGSSLASQVSSEINPEDFGMPQVYSEPFGVSPMRVQKESLSTASAISDPFQETSSRPKSLFASVLEGAGGVAKSVASSAVASAAAGLGQSYGIPAPLTYGLVSGGIGAVRAASEKKKLKSEIVSELKASEAKMAASAPRATPKMINAYMDKFGSDRKTATKEVNRMRARAPDKTTKEIYDAIQNA